MNSGERGEQGGGRRRAGGEALNGGNGLNHLLSIDQQPRGLIDNTLSAESSSQSFYITLSLVPGAAGRTGGSKWGSFVAAKHRKTDGKVNCSRDTSAILFY